MDRKTTMFQAACNTVRQATYGCLALTSTPTGQPNEVTIQTSNGSGFMVAPGYIITAAHGLHVGGDVRNPRHQAFEVIRVPDIGQPMETATFVAEDVVLDIGLLQIAQPRDLTSLTLHDKQLERGTSCGFLGFPLATVEFTPQGRRFNLQERFQGAFISNHLNVAPTPQTPSSPRYEIDRLMYSGSSGCPGFDVDGTVLGIQVASLTQPATAANPAVERVAIAFVVPSQQILTFVRANGVTV